MKRFDSQGKLLFPDTDREERNVTTGRLLHVHHCYCPHGHSLMSETAMFNDHRGIFVTLRTHDSEGLVALSPFFGDKARISLAKFTAGDLCDIACPECSTSLPVYSQCSCGGDIIALFTGQDASFANCLGICNRVGCHHARIRQNDELLIQTLESSIGNDLFWQQACRAIGMGRYQLGA